MIVERNVVLELIILNRDIARRSAEHKKRLPHRRRIDRDRHVLLRVGREAAAVFVDVFVLQLLVHIPDAAIAIADLRREVVGLRWRLRRLRVGGECGAREYGRNEKMNQ